MTTYRCPKCGQTVTTTLQLSAPPTCSGKQPRPHKTAQTMTADSDTEDDK